MNKILTYNGMKGVKDFTNECLMTLVKKSKIEINYKFDVEKVNF